MSFKKGCIAVTVGVVIGIGGVAGIEYVKNSKVEANFEETIENIKKSDNNLVVVVDSLKSEMNEHVSYPVSYSKATLKNFNVYKEEIKYMKNIFTGEILKKPFSDNKDWIYSEPTVSTYAQAKTAFSHSANMQALEYQIEGDNKIIAKINMKDVFLNNDSIAVDMSTYKELEPETVGEKTYKNHINNDAQLLEVERSVGTKDSSSIKANAQRAWQVKYVEDAPSKINELYSSNEDKKIELANNTKASIEKLLNTTLISVMNALEVTDESIELEVQVQL